VKNTNAKFIILFELEVLPARVESPTAVSQTKTEEAKMCRKIYMLMNIENVTAADVVVYLKRLIRLYVIFSAVAVYNAIVAHSNSGHLLFTLKVLDAIFYIINCAGVAYFVSSPTLCNLYFPLTTASCLWLFYLASIIIQIAASEHNNSAAAANIAVALIRGLLSLLLLGSTIFILLKLRTKIIVGGMENGVDMGQVGGVAQNPIYANNNPNPNYNAPNPNNNNTGGVVYGNATAPAYPAVATPVDDPYAKKYSNNV
jgi:hypothetical protein